jgi:hypothetical protein
MESQPATAPAPVVFRCGACGLSLSVPATMAGATGPCPSCGAWISSPATADTESSGIPSQRASALREVREVRRKGRIPADSIVDQSHLAQRETAQTIKVIALFIAAFCACLAVLWFMRDWMTE